jgi:outer membrane protein, heavy metal efflux system
MRKPSGGYVRFRNFTGTGIMIGIILLFSIGCAKYHSLPLNGAVKKASALPDLQKVGVYAATIQHPVLRPVQFDLQDGLTPDEAAILAVYANPSLRAERDLLAEAQAQLVQAGLLPNPQISASIDRPTGGTMAGTNTASSVGLGWDVTSLFTRPSLIRAAGEQKTQVDLSVAWREVQVAAAARASVYRLIAMEQQQKLMVNLHQSALRHMSALKRAAQTGLSTEQEMAPVRVIVQNIEIDQEKMEKAFRQEQLFLRRLLGVSPNYAIRIQNGTSLPTHLKLPSEGKLVADLSRRRLDILALRHGYTSQEEALRTAILDQFPRISLGINHARDNSNLFTIGAGVSIEFPIFDRNQGRIAQERATRQQLYDAFTNRIFQARADVAALINRAHSLNRRITLNKQALNTLKSTLSNYQKGLEQGIIDLPTVIDMRDLATRKQMELVSEKSDLAQLGMALSLASGYYNLDDCLTSSQSSDSHPERSIKAENP